MSEIDTREWVGFVVKTGDLTAQVASVSGIRTVLHQVEQVLDHEIVDPLTSARFQVRACWVVTTGRILAHALDDAAVTMRRHHLDKLIRWVDGAALTRLLSERLPRPVLVEMLRLEAKKESTDEQGEGMSNTIHVPSAASPLGTDEWQRALRDDGSAPL